ncbi:MAG: NADP-dependent malic enzyme [Candidatus Peribacteria bacterium]|jgi:malate dehydrogenase (oxaloacetate-decarboxylating)|nr:NADP-dependent malic enzyme [Candidatus Peribacteria bacterium]
MTDYGQLALQAHLQYKGKLETHSKVPLTTAEDLSTFYSPGVAAPCLEIEKNPASVYDLTRKSNTIAIVSDGSAVLGLGNIGGLAGLPVMEGKAILFKEFGDVDAIPIVLSTQDPDEVIKAVEAIAPTFGGINLEDISAPNCFYIETELKKRLNIPVFHDDQHGTAIVVLAGLINALKLRQEKQTSQNTVGIGLAPIRSKNTPIRSKQKIVISGAGAAAIAIGKLLHQAGATNIIFTDSKGVISSQRSDLNPFKKEVLPFNLHDVAGTLQDALQGADIFIGVSKGNLLKAEDIHSMATDPIIFALANPTPEIMPDEAKSAGAFIIATGRSDFPNQVNNVLAFPGIFRGALDARLPQITDAHKVAAAEALASYIQSPNVDHILPSALDKGVAKVIAEAVMKH